MISTEYLAMSAPLVEEKNHSGSPIIYFALSMLLLLLMSLRANAATLTLNVVDDVEKPVNQTVVALIPKSIQNYHAQTTAIMDQRNNTFVPGVLAVRVNTLVYFPNSDNIRHHVYSFSPAKRFELRLYHGMTAEPVLFDKPGQVILGCNIHDSMLGYIYVLETDMFAISNAEGIARISDIPAGEYELYIQHPLLDSSYPLPQETLVLSDNSNITKSIRLPHLLPDPRALLGGGELETLFKR